MATITINDLAYSHALDRRALLSIRGAGAGDWSIFAFQPYRPPVSAVAPSVSFFSITNTINNNYTFIENQTNQFTMINIDSAGSASPVTAVVIPTLGAVNG
ncbi:MAG: mediator of RNA polymerase II transcription subunit 20 [Rhizobacter sp.]|nr:mediator of RNA polymerase II transcription subunit 20 [Rhizobacter sp.]